MVVVILMMVILLSITGAALLFSGLNLKAASNLRTGGGAIHAADAGVQHALTVISSGTTFNYSSSGTPVVPTTVFPTSTSGYSYTVTATNNPPASLNTSTAILTSTATGPNNSRRVIRAYIGRSSSASWVPPAAVYIPGPASNPDFSIHGSVIITGNDTNVDNTPGPAAALPGIATNSTGTTQQVMNGIGTPANVTGAGGTTPSVATTTPPVDINALINSFLAQPYTTLTSGSVSNGTLGTSLVPQITYCNCTTTNLSISGTTSGVGVLIVDGKLNIRDTFNFQGIIITRGGEVHIELTSSSSTGIWGVVFISPASPEIEIEGGGAIKYSSQAINKVFTTWPTVPTPQKAKLIAWSEVMQ